MKTIVRWFWVGLSILGAAASAGVMLLALGQSLAATIHFVIGFVAGAGFVWVVLEIHWIQQARRQ